MAFLPALGTGLGTGFGASLGAGAIDAIFGGGGSSGGQSADPWTTFSAQMAAQNNPLTYQYQMASLLGGAYAAQLGQLSSLYTQGQASQATEALQRAQKDAQLQASAAGYTYGKGIDSQYNLNQARLATELMAPQFTQQAGSAALAGENELAMTLGKTNIGIKALQEQLRGQLAFDQGTTMNDVFQTRAENEGRLALGTQAFESSAALDQVKTLGDLARIQATNKGQMAQRQQGFNMALYGTKAFA